MKIWMVQVWIAMTATLLMILAGAALAADWPVVTAASIAAGITLLTLVLTALMTPARAKPKRWLEWWSRSGGDGG